MTEADFIRILDERLDAKLDAKFQEFEDKMDKRFQSLEQCMDLMELKQNSMKHKLDSVSLDVKVMNRDLSREIHHLQDGQSTIITVLEGRGIWPSSCITV